VVEVQGGPRRPAPGGCRSPRNDFEVYDSRGQADHHGLLGATFYSQADAGSGTKAAIRCGAPAGAAGPKSEPRPAYVALCFDDLNMDPVGLKPVKGSGGTVRQNRPGPRRPRGGGHCAQSQDPEFTGDVPKLVERIAKVTNHQRTNDESVQQVPHVRPYEGIPDRQ